MIDKNGKVYRGLQAQVAYLTEKVENGGGGSTPTGPTVDKITALDLATGEAALTYDANNGATIVKQGQISADGNIFGVAIDDKLPIVAGDNVTIAANETNNALKISAATSPVNSVNGQTGAVVLKTSDLENNSNYVTTSYHDNSKQDTLVSGTNIKTINGNSLLGSGDITISGGGGSGVTSLNGKTGAITLAAGTNVTINESNNTLTINATGGGSGTNTGFDNVREIQAADNQTTYNPDTKEYIISSGNADIFYKDGTKTTIPYVQEIGLMAGNNITFTEELVDNTNYRVKINATGGGSASDGFNNLKGLTLTPITYQGPETPSGKFAFTGSGTYTLKDNSSGGIENVSFQLPVVPGDGIIFEKDTSNNCVIKAEGYKPTIILETSTATQQTSHYGRIYYSFEIDGTIIDAVANGKYNVTIYDQTSSGGYYYCPLQGDTMTFLGEEVPNNNDSGKPSYIVGWSFKAKESTTVLSFWRDSLSLSGGGGGSAKLYQHNIETQCDPATFVYWTGYTSDNTPLTSLANWQAKFGNDKVYGGGYIKYNQTSYYPILYTQADSEGVKSYYAGNSMGSDLSVTYKWGGTTQWTDTVKEV